MKVLFPIGSYYPAQVGGQSNSVYWLVKSLINNKIEVDIITTQQGLKPIHNLSTNKWYDKGFGHVFYAKTKFFALPLEATWQSLKVLKKTDVLHLTSLFFPVSWLLASFNTLFYKKTVIWSVRGELADNALIYSAYKKKPILWYINLFLKKRVVFHSTSDQETLFLQKRLGKNISIVQIPNLIETPNSLDYEKENFLLYLGRIHPIKALDNLIHALKLSHGFVNSKNILIIAGDDNNDYANELKMLVNQLKLDKKVKFVGHVSGSQKEIYLSKAKCLILPSHTENFGNVVLEALAQKTPVIAAKGTPWAILETYNAGFWVDNNAENLAKVLDTFTQLIDIEIDALGNNARALCIEKFDISNNIVLWLDLYNTLNKQ
jgi:glycosyltransferase involved in cell wall biosynthesis